MKTTLTIENVEQTISKAGKKYWKVKTDQGQMSCFEDNVAGKLLGSQGKKLTVEVNESADGKFKNIREIYNGVNGGEVIETEYTQEPFIKKEKVGFRTPETIQAQALLEAALNLYISRADVTTLNEAAETICNEFDYIRKRVRC